MKLISISEGVESGQIPFTAGTIYTWHSLGKYPDLVFKVGPKLFFDLDEWEKMSRLAKDKRTIEKESI